MTPDVQLPADPKMGPLLIASGRLRRAAREPTDLKPHVYTDRFGSAEEIPHLAPEVAERQTR